MGNSRNSSSSEELASKVTAALTPAVLSGSHLALGLSGGIDSVALLSILVELAPALQFSLRAVHVNHGISPSAARWGDFCAELCRELQVPLQLELADIGPYRGLGLEGAARKARYRIFAHIDTDFVVFAQHRDDQAETLLLRLLRGAGLRGLAAMAPLRELPGARARLLRPLLDISRAEIESYARARGLRWVEDESNADTARRRNFLRHDVLPLIERQFPGARQTIARAAGHLREARDVLEDVARIDLERCLDRDNAIETARLRLLGRARAKNLLRYWCGTRSIQPPRAAQINELLRQLQESRADAHVSLATPGWRFLRYREKLYLEPVREAVRPDFRQPWDGENALPLLALGGVMRFKAEEGRGLSVAKLRQAPISLRLRKGGERLRPDLHRPRRALKNLFQERGVPPWRRDRLPLVYCGEELVSVPGVAEACEFAAEPDERGLIVSWEPFAFD